MKSLAPAAVAFLLFCFFSYLILQIVAATGYFGWLSILAACCALLLAELALKGSGLFKTKK